MLDHHGASIQGKRDGLVEATRFGSPWLTPIEAANYLGIALGTLRNWTSARFIPHAKRRGIVRYHRCTIDRWLERGACAGRRTFASGE
jgi:excisionase family DNA binding protein